MRNDFESDDALRQPWESDPDAWRTPAPASTPPAERWPQLSAGPAYWMWLALFERERRIDG